MKTIGIIGAMPSELKDLREALPKAETHTAAQYEFYINSFPQADKRIVSVCCGIGKVNAAVCTQLLIDLFDADYVINTGVAGGIAEETKVCDIVVSSDVMHHDLKPPFLDNYPPHHSCFEADPLLVSAAVKVCQEKRETYYVGRVVSGEMFVSSSQLKDEIVSEFHPYAVDMESAAIGHCCYRNGVPFLVVRCLSDKADEEGEMSFETFEKIAAAKVAAIVLAVADQI